MPNIFSTIARFSEFRLAQFEIGANALPIFPIKSVFPSTRYCIETLPRSVLTRFMHVIVLGMITIMIKRTQFASGKLRYSNQRSLVHQIVESAHDHPTAQAVFERARKRIPSISLG